jgi:hypothetical protein
MEPAKEPVITGVEVQRFSQAKGRYAISFCTRIGTHVQWILDNASVNSAAMPCLETLQFIEQLALRRLTSGRSL